MTIDPRSAASAEGFRQGRVCRGHRASSQPPTTTQPRDARRNRLDNRPKTLCKTMEGFTGLDSLNRPTFARLWQSRRAHHAVCTRSCVSLARCCETARRCQRLSAGGLCGLRVSGCALARGFLVSAPPVSASWKPFPGAESRDRFARRRRPVRKIQRVCVRTERRGKTRT